MKNPFSSTSSAKRLFEDELYARVFGEMETGQLDRAAQARAMEEGGGDEGAVKKAYIKHRIVRIKAETEIANERAAKATAEAEKVWQENEAQRLKQEREKTSERQRQDMSDVWRKIFMIFFVIFFVFPVLLIFVLYLIGQ